MIQLPWLDQIDSEFPPVQNALTHPNGLLAVGGDLSAQRILSAYERGIFPWYNPGEPILWWSPNPRAVLLPKELKISKSLRKTLRKNYFKVTFDQSFTNVVRACAQPRTYSDGTWINDDIVAGYSQLHSLGKAHSVEVWKIRDSMDKKQSWEDFMDKKQSWELVGGLYGVALGKIFFGESMFARATDASKVGFAFLVRQLIAWDFQLIDCQVPNEHTSSLGARELSREEFLQYLLNFVHTPAQYPHHWSDIILEPWSS